MKLPTKIYIRKDSRGFPADYTAFKVYQTASDLNIPVEFFDEITNDIHITGETPVCGTVNQIKRAFEISGLTIPDVSDYPEDLGDFLGRKIYKETVLEAKTRLISNGFLFIKSVDVKTFTGKVFGIKEFLDVNLNDQDYVYTSYPLNIVGEFRGFVHNGSLVWCCPYRGDFTASVDYGTCLEMISAWNGQPCAYSLDFGVTDRGETILVEVNDFWAVGAYEVPAKVYFEMLVDRWREMFGRV